MAGLTIREFVVSTKVAENNESETSKNQGYMSLSEEDKKEVIQSCTNAILEIIQRQFER